jgi:hypothetical protein
MKNLIHLYEQMTIVEKEQGMVWYQEAHDYAAHLADKYSHSQNAVCGIIAALSPSCRWERNRLEAEWLMQSNLEDFEMEPFNFTTYGQGVIKAQRIYSGEKFDWFNEKTGPKTYHFYNNILNPESPEWITLDRHAYYAATGEKLINGLKIAPYRKMAEHYKKAAKKLNILPNQLQAILWLGVQNDLI